MSTPAAPSASPAIWFLTGASSGFGRSLAESVLASGDRLIATAREPSHLASLAATYPASCEIMALDVTDAAQVASVVAAAARVV